MPAAAPEPEPQPEPQPPLGTSSRADVPWKDAVLATQGGRPITPRQLRRRMRGEEKARVAAARRGKVKLQAAVGALGMMRDAAQAQAQAEKLRVAAAAEAERAAAAHAEEARAQKLQADAAWAAAEARVQREHDEAEARREREEAEAHEREATRAAQRAAAAARKAEQAAATAAREAEEAAEQAAAAALPWGWELHKSASTGERYFFNTITGDCLWEPPTEEAWGLEEVPAELAAAQCWVSAAQSTSLRSAVELNSEVVGSVAPGELLFVLEFAHVQSGRGIRRARLRCYGGWLSVTARDGSVAVQLAEPPLEPHAAATGAIGEGSSVTALPLQVPTLLLDHDHRDERERPTPLLERAAAADGRAIAGRTAVMAAAGMLPLFDPAAGPAAGPAAAGERVRYVPTLYKRSMDRSCKGHKRSVPAPGQALAAAAR